MPLYEFKCNDCVAIFERLVPVGTITFDCPICKKECSKIISQMAPPVIHSSTPYQDNPTTSDKEIDHRIGETIEKKIRPVFEEREREKKEFREAAKEAKLKRVSTGDNGVIEYQPINDPKLTGSRKKMLNEFDTALQTHRKKREAQGLSQFDDGK